MDPWADSTPAWTPSQPTKSSISSQSVGDPTQLSDGPVDPWAESDHASTSIPVIPLYKAGAEATEDAPQSGNDFDPWGGNAAPMSPLSTDVSTGNTQYAVQNTDAAEENYRKTDEDWNPAANEPISGTPDKEERSLSAAEEADEEVIAVDEEDPWGSGAAARRIKVQNEGEAAAQRMEILRLQEEAKGKRMDDEDKSSLQDGKKDPEITTAKEDEITTPADSVTVAPVVSGWRSLFSKAVTKSNDASEETKGAKGAAKVETSVTKEANDSKESPRSATSTTAPRLWQAPTILGNHTRSASSASRTSSNVEAVLSSTKGPGWEITTKKPQQSASGGGFIQSIFGASHANTNSDGKTVITATRKEEKTGGLNRFGRGLQPPPVVSAADEEDDSFDTSETGIEWDSSNAFEDQKKKPDLLSDDGEGTTVVAGSTMGKLLDKLRGRNAKVDEAVKSNDMSKADLSWLDTVGEGSKSTTSNASNDNADLDWLALLGDRQSQGAFPKATPDHTQTTNNSKVQLISSTSRATPSAKIPPLAPPPSGSRTSSPFSVSGVASSKGQQAPFQTSRSVTGFEEPFVDEEPSPNLNGGYKDDFTDNHASLLNGRPGPPDRKTSNFMRTFQSRPSKGKYDYDEDEEEARNENWSAFRDEPHAETIYRDDNRQNISSMAQAQDNEARNRSIQGSITVNTISKSISPPPSSSNRLQAWDKSGPLLAGPPGRPSSVGLVKQNSLQSASASASPSSKALPKALSQGKMLTNDDLSFFESL